MKFTILFACFLFAVASADHNPFDVLPVDVSGPEDRVPITTPDDWIADRDRTTTPKAVVPIDVGTEGHHGLGDHESSTAVPVEPTEPKPTTNNPEASTTEQPEQPTSTVVDTTTTDSDSSTTVEPTDAPTDVPTTELPSTTTEVNPSSTEAPTETPTEPTSTSNPTTSNPTGPTEGPTSENPTSENPSTENPTTAHSATTEKPSGEAPKGWSTGSIAGVVIGSLFGAAMLVGGILFASHRMKQRRSGDHRPLVEA